MRGSSTVAVSGGIVRGTVVDPAPVAGAHVTIFHGGTPITTRTDANGAFDVEGVVGTGDGRAFSVRATNGTLLGYTDAMLSVPGGWATVTVVLVPLSTISGTVYQADGTTAVGAGVRVDLFEAAHPTTIFDTRFTDASGHYEFRLVAPGSYTLEASDLAGNRGRSTASVGTSGQDVIVPISYLGRGTVAGIVRDALGPPVANAQLDTARVEHVRQRRHADRNQRRRRAVRLQRRLRRHILGQRLRRRHPPGRVDVGHAHDPGSAG